MDLGEFIGLKEATVCLPNHEGLYRGSMKVCPLLLPQNSNSPVHRFKSSTDAAVAICASTLNCFIFILLL